MENDQWQDELKLKLLKEKVARAEADIARGDVMEGNEFFAQLMPGIPAQKSE